ncbi:bacterial Ig-like domain-containing protein [Furfurilactobacillus milii]|uniref:Bacterial Ig-like domain-containing protein n=1 Tax=Furfurilactobacillus milii TaxID=2888272 RepID=A0ABT6D9S7_9LACO|nr:bacterial Ig-like domain-containing protein [Furfurilactobacillus milii]QLE65576.1 peptidoglycan bound protein LPXTG motif [Furfurilactobacillus rossiae]MCF6161156.1 bacterial Ig-like domain-containing protein [Furfurilactobacillus milii]MCF6163589.1 bacterial Ig-like domain-containing protein [Furfurilactobacillus milii]MDF9913876.1 bacterial Ig-like domain-containing protein [Furfurilactobacillus milii]QLE68006.1 peptidoglycan bound protein LPXTG motif [Furfurilactobacillus rossiae]
MIAGPKTTWTASDNFDGATDINGKVLQLSDVKVTGSVNTQVPGDYSVTYGYVDSQGNNVSKKVVVHVTATQAWVSAHDSYLVSGPNTTWTPSDNFDSATDANGKSLQLSDMTVTGNVNPQVTGGYSITYSYVDSQGNRVSRTVGVYVTASKASVKGHDSNLIAGPNTAWTAGDNFDGATDAKGKPLQLSDVKVTGSVNPQVPGDYSVTYSYTDSQGNNFDKTVVVHVTASQASVKGHDSNLIAGPNTTWTAGDNFDGATDANGKPLQLSDVKTTGSVNPQIPGDYSVTYSYVDTQGNNVDKTVIVHVTASQESVTGHDSNLVAGPNTTWTASDNFDGATDANGKALQLSDIKVTGTVNAQVPGDYSVTYSYVDSQGNNVTKMVVVHVAASKISVLGHDSSLIAGPKTMWTLADNFDGATDINGKPLQLNDVTVSGSVNPQVAGDYSVVYSYVDGQGNNVSKTVAVHVLNSQASVTGHDSNLVAGPNTTWTAADNFDGATDITGKPLRLSDVNVTGSVNPQIPGDYSVTYSYVDSQGNDVSKMVVVHVEPSQASIHGHNSNLIAGPNTAWTASDNFDGATDANGKAIQLNDVKVTGNVNPQVPGDYSITYSYVDSQGNNVDKAIIVHVVASQASILAHDSNLIAGPNTTWTANDNFESATDINGKALQLNNLKVTGKVNPQVPGDYSVTYNYVDSQGNEVSKTVVVHVTASHANVNGHDGNMIAGPNVTWTADNNFDSAVDANGKPLQLSDMKVTGMVNPQVAGNYYVTYSYVDSQGNEVSKTVVVHVTSREREPANPESKNTMNQNDTVGKNSVSVTKSSTRNQGNIASINGSLAKDSSIMSAKTSKERTSELPKTGQQSEYTLSLLGLVLSLLGLNLYRPRHKKQ